MAQQESALLHKLYPVPYGTNCPVAGVHHLRVVWLVKCQSLNAILPLITMISLKKMRGKERGEGEMD